MKTDSKDYGNSLSGDGLPGLAIRRPVTMVMVFFSLLVVGAVSFYNIPVQLFPGGFDPPFLYIWFSYPNASPVENQERIAIPVEEALWTVKGVNKISLRSSSNYANALMEFDQDVDMNVAYLAVRDRLERVKPELPDDLQYVYIWRYSDTDEPILYCSVSITGNYEDPYRVIEEKIVKQIERVDGIAKVELWGSNAKMVRIEFILDRLKAYGLSIPELMTTLINSNFVLSGGSVYDSESKLLVRVDGRIKNLDDLKELPVNGQNLHLKDIAEVSYSEPPQTWVERIGRSEAVEIGVYKESDANTVELNHKLDRLLEQVNADPNLSGLKIDKLFDQGKYITQSLDNLKSAGLWGGLFAIFVLFFFLRRVRMTLFITLAIPFSLLVTLISMYFMGWSLNLITLSSMMICVGLVVDNAIVVTENIQTCQLQGMPIKKAAVVGANEVAMAITLATLTTAVVFLPLMLMSGDRMLAFFMKQIGLPVIIALVASLMMALLFIPLATHHIALAAPVKSNSFIEKSAEGVSRLVNLVLKHRLDTVIVLLLLMASIGIPMKKVVETEQEEGNINDFRMHFKFPAYYTLAHVDSFLTSVEDELYKNEIKYDIKTTVTGFRRGFGRIRVFLNESPDRVWFMAFFHRIGAATGLIKSEIMSRDKVLEDIKEWLKPPPGVEMYSSWGTGTKEKSVNIIVSGDQTEKLLKISNEVKRRLELVPEAISVEMDLETTSDEVQISFNRGKTSRFGVDPFQAASGMIGLMRGVSLPDIWIDGHDISASAELRLQDRETLAQVMNLPVGGMREETIRLNDVANVSYGRGLGDITRENRQSRIRLKVTTTEEDMKKLSGAIDAKMKNLKLPAGYEWSKGERFTAVEESNKERGQAWLMAIMFVFLLMGALFESFTLPWCVIATVPFSFFGVWWLLFLTGTQFGLMAVIGVIILIGVVVNNAIVLVDRANTLRNSGMERDTALALASQQRFRAITMTAATTVMGLIPMAAGDANLIGIPYAPMGRAIIGGMLAATISTPVVVPLAYSLIDDLTLWLKKYARSFRMR